MIEANQNKIALYEIYKFLVGYLMSGLYSRNHQQTFECIDANPEYVTGESTHDESALVNFQRAACGRKGVPCPPYYGDRELTCVVCTK